MTFGARTFQGMQQSQVISGSAAISDIVSSGLATGTATLNANGTITYAGNTSVGPAAWYSPPGGSPGSTTWYATTVTATSGSLGSNASGSLSGGLSLSYSVALNAISKIGTVVVRLYGDSGLTNLLGTITFSVDVESSNH